MTRCASHIAVIVLLWSLALPAWGQQYFLYEPKPVTAEEKNQAKDGVLVTEVPVKKGDTLYDISRKFSGHGMYYPQILLFNKIKNPKLIYPGNTLKVPVTLSAARTESAPVKESAGKTKKSAPGIAPVTEIPLSDLKSSDQRETRKSLKIKKGATKSGVRDKNKKHATVRKSGTGSSPAGDSVASQKLFERAVNAYKLDDFGTALDLFERYLANNANSPLAADASLYKADCYLKLSSQ